MESYINTLVKDIEPQVIKWRRFLHENPELSFEEINTSQFVFDTLTTFDNLEVTRPTKTSVVAKLIGVKPGKTLAIRADMDALPIQELNEFDFKSKNDGVMHACGHDGHTAILLGTAKILSELKTELIGDIHFIFQHAEELHPGGAQEMVKAGVMKDVDQVIGLHLMSPIDRNILAIGDGAVTANSDVFHLTVEGKGGHASEPQHTIDPIVVGAQIVTNLQQIISRKLDVNDKAVISITKFNGGTANNIIPNTVKITGSIRTVNEDIRTRIPVLIEQVIKGITSAHGASYDLAYNYGYSAVVNDKALTSEMSQIGEEVFGKGRVLHFPPGTMMGSEDFSAFSNEVPACFLAVGAGNKDDGIIYPHHHPKFTIDESSLVKGVELFVRAGLSLNR